MIQQEEAEHDSQQQRRGVAESGGSIATSVVRSEGRKDEAELDESYRRTK